MNSPLIQRLETRKNRALAAIYECDKKHRDIELQRERLRGEVSALDDAIHDTTEEAKTPNQKLNG